MPQRVQVDDAAASNAIDREAIVRDWATSEVQQRAHLVRHLRSRHWTMLWLSAAVVAASFLLGVGQSGRVGPAWLPRLSLPELCMSRSLFGVECTGCGLTRSFIALAHGDVAQSFRYNHVGWLLALAVLAQFPYRILGLRETRTHVVERRWPIWVGWLLIAALVGNWLGKMFGYWREFATNAAESMRNNIDFNGSAGARGSGELASATRSSRDWGRGGAESLVRCSVVLLLAAMVGAAFPVAESEVPHVTVVRSGEHGYHTYRVQAIVRNGNDDLILRPKGVFRRRDSAADRIRVSLYNRSVKGTVPFFLADSEKLGQFPTGIVASLYDYKY